MSSRGRDPVSEALGALLRGDVDAPAVRDILAGRVLCNPTDRELVAELRSVALRVARHCAEDPANTGTRRPPSS